MLMQLSGISTTIQVIYCRDCRDILGATQYSELHVDVYTNSSWTLDVVPVMTNVSTNWTRITVSLRNFTESTIVIRLRVVETSCKYHECHD